MPTREESGFTSVSTRRGERALVADEFVAMGVSAEDLWSGGEALEGARGRGGVCVLRPRPDVALVARDYRRGGALRFLGERYLHPDRVEDELRLLAELAARGVPVVEPVAALARRRGISPFWRLRLVTRLWEGALPLPQFVASHPAHRGAAVRTAGEIIGRAFSIGLSHPDLHPDNLVARLTGGVVEMCLLDLDRARLVRLRQSDQDRMLLRMARYLRKHRTRMPLISVRDDLRFLQGMGLSRAARRARLLPLVPALRKELQRHGLSQASTVVAGQS